jgi:hypothetical protein
VTDDEQQEAVQHDLSHALTTNELLPDGAVLTGWCIAYEYRTGETVAAGAMRGPSTITAWNAIGLLEWARMCINEGVEDDG